jgi:hypothetical protein
MRKGGVNAEDVCTLKYHIWEQRINFILLICLLSAILHGVYSTYRKDLITDTLCLHVKMYIDRTCMILICLFGSKKVGRRTVESDNVDGEVAFSQAHKAGEIKRVCLEKKT